jgi:uncharacterized membrane protein YphA (DoxX/SURF4 family)
MTSSLPGAMVAPSDRARFDRIPLHPVRSREAHGFQRNDGLHRVRWLAPSLGTVGAIIVEVLLGAALLIGWQARWSALIMAGFTMAAAVFFHNFWASPPDQQLMQNVNFFKNVAIAGGLLFVFAFGPGAYSLDARIRRRDDPMVA